MEKAVINQNYWAVTDTDQGSDTGRYSLLVCDWWTIVYGGRMLLQANMSQTLCYRGCIWNHDCISEDNVSYFEISSNLETRSVLKWLYWSETCHVSRPRHLLNAKANRYLEIHDCIIRGLLISWYLTTGRIDPSFIKDVTTCPWWD